MVQQPLAAVQLGKITLGTCKTAGAHTCSASCLLVRVAALQAGGQDLPAALAGGGVQENKIKPRLSAKDGASTPRSHLCKTSKYSV